MKVFKDKGDYINYPQNIAEELDKAYAEGYRFMTKGNIRRLPDIAYCLTIPYVSDLVLFADEEEAREYSDREYHIAHPDAVNVHGYVEAIPQHTKTLAEINADWWAKEEAREARRLAKKTAKAEACGMTLDEYEAHIKKQRQIKSLCKEIEEVEETLADYKAELKDLKQRLKALQEG